ncbi:HPr family phosphocarrier protein [Loktanella sp. R86503]|uniref:HPr family phosphocarrier protein n=1 Tax=Loktanella sp. R86503 TaxID=3093847 RepID=UPI0036D854C0
MAQTRLKIQNVKGLHARASAKLVEVVEAFDATATVSKDGMQAGGDSIMGLLMLAATVGSWIDVDTRGPDAQALSDAITALIDDKFGEGG